MEFSGKGLDSLVTAMNDKKAEMASLGARLLQSDKKAAETAETARINKSGDSNVLASIVSSVEGGINRTLSIMSQWQSLTDNNTVGLNRDFVDGGLTGQDLTAMFMTMQGGGMSLESFVYNTKKHDLLPDGRTIEEEMEAIASQAPNLNEV